MFKSLAGALLGALVLWGGLPRPAQARDLELLEVYELVAAMVSRQNPFFLFPGLHFEHVTVNGDGGEYHVVINGLGLPGSSATVPEPATLRLPRTVPDGDLIEVTVEGLPTSTIMPEGQSLKLIAPEFSGVWSIKNRGFDSFELSVDSIRFQGAGISYTAKGLTSTLQREKGKHVLSFAVERFVAEYGKSFTGTERAKSLNIELSFPEASDSGQVLVALAYRLSGLLFRETEIQQKLAPDPPEVSTMDGLQISIDFAGESWAQTVPPSEGTLGRTSLLFSVEPDEEADQSRLRIDATLASLTQTLDRMRVDVREPSTLVLALAGMDSQVLADLLLDRYEGFDAPALGQEVSLMLDVEVGDTSVAVPQLELDFTAKRLSGGLQSVPQSDGGQNFEMTGAGEQLNVANWLNKDALEPFASMILTPAMPQEAAITLGLEGLSADEVQGLLTAVLSLDFGDIGRALPKDIASLTLVLKDSFYTSRLLQMEFSSRLKLRQGRIPVEGTMTMLTGPLAPLQIGMQQSIGTPVPAVSQAMSAGLLGLTLLQTFAVREDGGQLRFEMEFPETGGLPLVNGRPLPFQQFLR